jgi:hypothetical protein
MGRTYGIGPLMRETESGNKSVILRLCNLIEKQCEKEKDAGLSSVSGPFRDTQTQARAQARGQAFQKQNQTGEGDTHAIPMGKQPITHLL